MKILWLYGYNSKVTYNHWLHIDFAKALKQQNQVQLMAYGNGLRKAFPELAPISFNPEMTLKDLKKEFDFDIIIMNNKNRMYYNLAQEEEVFLSERDDSWLPSDFNTFNIPKVMIETDFHYKSKEICGWYSKVGIDLLLQRHLSNIKEANDLTGIKNKWLPFCVDTNIFKPNNNIERKNKVCFIGHISPPYIHRKEAKKILDGNLAVFKRKIFGNKYIKCLQSFTSHLNGSSIYDITAGKMFEIMASGSVLFTNESCRYGLRDLFPIDSYCTYKENYTDIKQKAKMIINDKDYRLYTTQKALKCIKERHTQEIRGKELIEIINKEFGVF